MPGTTTIMAGGWTDARPSTPPEGVIRVETSFTVEEVFIEPEPANNQSTNTIFGDSSSYYQATVWSAASRFARNLFEPEVNNGRGGNINIDNTTTGKWVATALLLAFVNLLTMVTESMMPVMIPTIIYDLNVQGFQWLIAGPAIGAAATALIAGHLYVIVPFKQIYMVFAVIVLIATISPGFTPNMAFLFYTRILLGVGLAGQHLGTLVFLEHKSSFADKVRRDFFLTVSSTLGLIVGPIFGSIFAHRDKNWSWAFYTAFILLALVLVFLFNLLPKEVEIAANAPWACGPVFNWSHRLNCIDTLGGLLSFFGIITLLITFNFAGTLTPWTDGYLYISLAIGVVLIVLLILQQAYKILNSPSTRLFPVEYVPHFKTMALFVLVFLTAGIFQTVLSYTALYQLFTRPQPSAVTTAFYLFFTITGPYLIPVLLIPVYLGGGLMMRYPMVPSYSFWSTVSSAFLLVGTALLFINMPSVLPGSDGLPTIGREFALACIGCWSTITLSMAHQLMDLLQSPVTRGSQDARQKHPLHNRAFVLFASYLGAAVSLTIVGSIFMHVGPRAELALLSQANDAGYPASVDNALVLLLGYTFIDGKDTPALFGASIAALENAFGWSFVPVVAFAVAACAVSAALLVAKAANRELPCGMRARRAQIPEDWRAGVGARGRDIELEDRVSGTTL
ncbi:uncharacterized protein Z520_11003 [Fonsecaea multimorphosa CBS 102226]|uniref:Major facilitator superfamily (MFS) profile domain-containing protein n=1 Tax=Fonsecaea multimorphosa CBS 102226 TaxID=1442371 RepID=A0A0D2GUZ7_9EURO|nr:uncharacterized protein Z520_11003 [Fonsecaea multimorphosa CBS 102226]KIX93360.1 hypothetical protein Z520_11003 [Fonsecaea multimorphosa CBS 102226]OAL18596.1 hypothetical protein AYO22_10573 [Fonsecaea multimorphosa]